MGSTDRPPPLIVLDDGLREDLRHWIETDRRVALRILKLMEAVARDPFRGMGNPEPLRHLGSNLWSRRLTEEERDAMLATFDEVRAAIPDREWSEVDEELAEIRQA